MELAEELETVSALSQPSSARSVSSSTQGRSPMLELSASEEVDMLSIDAGGM